MCKRLKVLDDQGAETSMIHATQSSVRKLLTKLDVCIKAVDTISSRIHKLRDEELQPQVNELIHGYEHFSFLCLEQNLIHNYTLILCIHEILWNIIIWTF